MKKNYTVILTAAVFAIIVFAVSATAETFDNTWGGNAAEIYNTGFMQNLMKAPGGVTLFDRELIQNDSPGIGYSEKGVFVDYIWGDNRVRKIFEIDDPRARNAYIVVLNSTEPSLPLTFSVNGHAGQIPAWDHSVNSETDRWEAFPAEWLKKGRNVIDLYCPEASQQSEGWAVMLARADEYAGGGGDPEHVGETSFKSTDGGRKWRMSPFGPSGDTRAEYGIRLNFDRYVPSGWLKTPVIDLWRTDSDGLILPITEVMNLRVTAECDVPEGAAVEYFLRKGTDPSPHADGWGQWMPIGSGERLDYTLDEKDIGRRYIQVRASLSTDNPLASPIVRSILVESTLNRKIPAHTNIRVLESLNEPIRYSSLDWEWEPWDRPEFARLREAANIDDLLAGCRTQFDAQVRVLNYISSLWIDDAPIPDFPAWDALSILERFEQKGAGGMCLQQNVLLAGMYIACGWQARHVNITHEVCEVWNDEYGKWVYMDAHRVNSYNYDIDSTFPLNIRELHQRNVESYYDDPIDWMTTERERARPEDWSTVRHGSLDFHDKYGFNGLTYAKHVRIIPRNNWIEKPYPRPLSNGMSRWQWDGYMNWYDDMTPPDRVHSRFTDRDRDLWPDINKVHMSVVSGLGNDLLFLSFETYTPNFCHYEIDVDGTGWEELTGDRYTWRLQSGINKFRVRAVNKLGVAGKPAEVTLNHVDAPYVYNESTQK